MAPSCWSMAPPAPVTPEARGRRWVRGPILRSCPTLDPLARSSTGDLDAAINLAEWAHPDVTTSAAKTLTACGSRPQVRIPPAGCREARTGIAYEPTGSIGGVKPVPHS